jgi:hypothetical protein
MPCKTCDKDLPARERKQVSLYQVADERRLKCSGCDANQGGQCQELGLPVVELTKTWSASCPRGEFQGVRQTCPICGRANQFLSRSSRCQWCEVERANKQRNQRRKQSPVVHVQQYRPSPIVATVASKTDVRWAVAVTTAPRRDCTLRRCIASIQGCGWEPTIFAEPGATKVKGVPLVENKKRLGVWHNWLQAARWSIDQDAEYVITIQDDSLFHPDSRLLIESIQWPADAAFVSLYTPRHYTVANGGKLRPVGVNKIRTSSLWGACALVWRPKVLAKVVDHPIAKTWLGVRGSTPAVIEKRKSDPALIANSDTAVGRICNAMGLGMYFVDPSPAAHIARHSTIGHGGNGGKRNAYRIADHSQPLVQQVFGK